jgi:tetratricopeptide (TPR) repeat protein
LAGWVEELEAYLAISSGDIWNARLGYTRAVELFERSGDIQRAVRARHNLADLSNRLGAFQEAAVALERVREDCLRIGNRVHAGWASLNLGYAWLALEDLAAADAAFDLARAIGEVAPEPNLVMLCDVYRARAARARGDLAASADIAERTVCSAREVDARMRLAQALTVLAEAKSFQGDSLGALEASREAMEIRDELGALEEGDAELFVVHSRTLEAVGRSDEATRALASGRQLVEANAARIPDVGWRERYLDSLPANRVLIGR